MFLYKNMARNHNKAHINNVLTPIDIWGWHLNAKKRLQNIIRKHDIANLYDNSQSVDKSMFSAILP